MERISVLSYIEEETKSIVDEYKEIGENKDKGYFYVVAETRILDSEDEKIKNLFIFTI